VDDFAKLPGKDRADLFQAAARQRSMLPAVIEKDFWVCWTLKRLFSLPNPRRQRPLQHRPSHWELNRILARKCGETVRFWVNSWKDSEENNYRKAGRRHHPHQ
jgi:hypothetical protein